MPIVETSPPTKPVPVLIAAWPGMGQVGVGVVEFLRRKLRARPCARIDVSAYHLPDSVEVADGIGRLPDPSLQQVYLVQEPPLFIFEGDTQLDGEAGIRLANELLDYVGRHGTETIYTGAAFAVAASFRQPAEVFGVATNERFRDHFKSLGVEALKQGRISGLNGLLLALAERRGMAAACFLATMPQYAIEAPNPKASKAVIEVMLRILNTSVDTSDIDAAIVETDRMLGEFESRVTAAIRDLKHHAEEGHEHEPEGEERESEERPEPHVLMTRIEELFEAAQHDRAKALLLKQELDRWGLFPLYEDRFLDLFHKTGSPPPPEA